MSLADRTSYLPSYVEIETSRFCNRRCPWCPNGTSEERTIQELMPWDLFARITSELADLGFSGTLGLTNYNEPLANPRLLDELRHVRSHLPGVSPRLYSNGDFLDRSLLDSLVSLGVGFLRVTVYPPATLKDLLPSQARIETFIARKGLRDLGWCFKQVRQGLAAQTKLSDMEFVILSPDLHTYSYRGGTSVAVDPLQPRTVPCFLTTYTATIDFRGRMKMCCCVFPGEPEHNQYILGDLNTESFLQIWTSQRLASLRRAHSRKDWSGSPACASCIHHSPEQPANFSLLAQIEHPLG